MAKVSIKNTKAQILQAFEEANKERIALQRELNQTKNSLGTAEQKLAQAGQPIIEEKVITKVVEKIPNIQEVEGILSTLEGIADGVSPALSNLSAKLSTEAEHLTTLLKDIEQQEADLSSLYELEVEADTVDKILEEYEKTQEEFEEEKREKRTNFEEDIREKRKLWKKENEEHQRLLQERNELDKQEKTRDYETYQYDLEHARALELDIYQEKQKALQKELVEFQEQKEEEWAEKEKTVHEREKEYLRYQEKFKKLPEKLEKEVKKAEAEGKAIGEKDAKVKADLLAKEMEGQKRLQELKVNALESQLLSQEERLSLLSAQLQEAYKQAQDLAVKTIEGQARSESFDAVREIALEQAKTQQKSK